MLGIHIIIIRAFVILQVIPRVRRFVILNVFYAVLFRGIFSFIIKGGQPHFSIYNLPKNS